MPLRELERWIMASLARARGNPIALPARAGTSENEMLGAIALLQRLRYVRVIGPPNMNSDIGQDVDELRLLPEGFMYLSRMAR